VFPTEEKGATDRKKQQRAAIYFVGGTGIGGSSASDCCVLKCAGPRPLSGFRQLCRIKRWWSHVGTGLDGKNSVVATRPLGRRLEVEAAGAAVDFEH